MKTYNIAPYFDDFSDTKNYHQIMFKPGFAVQARELSQLQTILRGQIEKFGNHVFKHGSVVIPGNSYADLAVPYVKILPTYNNTSLNLANFEGQVVVGITTGIKAVVKKAVAETTADPITFYLAYLTGNTSGAIAFNNGEELYLNTNSTIRATVQATNATGVGSLAFVNTGVYYINGTFVHVDGQSTIISKYDSSPSCHVLLQITEQLVDAVSDTTLLDPAQGSYNYAAPGADRVKISLTLTTLPLGSSITQDYVEIMRYNNGELEEHSKNPKYSELEKSLARRTYDESGDYVVRGILPTINQHLKTSNNNGIYTAAEGGDNDKLVVTVDAGKAYINGFEVEKLSNTRISIDKARTADHIKTTDIILRPNFGQYILVSNISKWFSVYSHETISIYNDNDSANASATLIGTARVVGVDYLIGSGSNTIYKLWINDLSLVTGRTLDEAGGIRYNSGGSAYVITQYKTPITSGGFAEGEVVTYTAGTTVRRATVRYWDTANSTLYAYKHDHTVNSPRLGDNVIGQTSSTTSVITEKTVITSAESSSNLIALPKSIPSSLVNPDTGDYDFAYTVQKEFTITTNASGNGSASIIDGTIQPIEVGTFLAVGSSGIVDNSKFALNIAGTELTLSGGPASDTVKVFANTLKQGSSGLTSKTKTITNHTETFKVWVQSTAYLLNDYVFYGNNLYKVSVAGTTNTVAPTHTSGSASSGTATLQYVSKLSTITLAKTDVISLTSVIAATGDITNRYTIWDGQTDYAYTRGELRLRSSQANPTTNFSVTYKYYQHSITGDFFCVDSYTSVPNFLEEVNVYKSQTTGIAYDLCAYLDFRPSVGADGSWTSSSSRRNDLIVSGTTFTSSLQYYVPRIDSLVIDYVGNVSVARGIPSENPVSPSISSGQLELNRIYLAEYTRSLNDVSGVRMDVERFTMRDIKKITDRITTLENYALLSASEISALDYNITDAKTGLNRYKTGYIVESFKDPFSIARSTNEEYKATFINDTLNAPVQPQLCEMILDEQNSSNYVIKNNHIMLPYTETVFASQPLSSRTNNINPFLVVRWNGYLDVSPKNDVWVEVIDKPKIFEEKTEEVVVNNYIPCPVRVSSDGASSSVSAIVNYFKDSNGVTKYQVIENTPAAKAYAASLNAQLGRTMISSSTVAGSNYSAIQNSISSKVSSGELAAGAKVNLFTGVSQAGSSVTINRATTATGATEKVARTYSPTNAVGTETRIF